MKQIPNLFNYATSELSQDAFISWLIQWADEEFKTTDSLLNNLAVKFVKKLLGKDDSYEIKKVVSGMQKNNIDVWAEVNDNYFIVIEDKKGSSEHSDQLRRYAESAKKSSPEMEIILVYFKMEEQGDYTSIEKEGFSHFTRSMMIEILKDYIEKTESIKLNNIIIDYYNYLVKLDTKINSYNDLPLDEWHWHSWTGFYTKLQEALSAGKWNYVSNPAGGFLGFWWHWKGSDLNNKGFEYYLQLEEETLIFKLIAYNEEDRREVRNHLREVLFKKAQELDFKIEKYGRIGEWMGIAKYVHDYRQSNENGLLDFEKTLEVLKKAMTLLDEVANDPKWDKIN